jgi:hypothetical protein
VTKKEREQVVDLLRCAADEWFTVGGGIATAARDIGVFNTQTRLVAVAAWERAADVICFWNRDLSGFSYGHVCLEAAARVEEGSWP